MRPSIDHVPKIPLKIVVIFVILCVLTSCGKDKEKVDSYTITDAMQRPVKVPKFPKRVVSMAPSNTEMLFAIGLDEEIVGVTNFCDYPESAKYKQKIGGYFTPNVEAILSLKPDLVIATPDGYVKKNIELLESAGISVFIVNPKNIDEILNTMLTLGKITKKEENAKRMVNELSVRIRRIRDRVAKVPAEMRPKVFYEISHDPLITTGPGTFVDDIINEAGGINIASDAKTAWPRYSVEAIIAKDPDIIITTPHATTNDRAQMPAGSDFWNRLSTISAVKHNRIYPVNPDILLRPGPRIVDGLELMHHIFEEFWKDKNIGRSR